MSKLIQKLIVIFFLTLKKERYHQLYYIFIINNCFHTPLMLAKYDTSFFTKDQKAKRAQYTFIFCSFTLRHFTVISLGKRLVISVSQYQGVKGSLNI